MRNIYEATLHCRHLVYEGGTLARNLEYRGGPVVFIRWLTRDEAPAGSRVMVQDLAGYKWEVDTKEVTVTGACPCGCSN